MKWILAVLGSLALLVGIAFAVGSVVPREHSSTRSAVYAQDADALWRAITGFREFPSWRSGLDSVRELGGGRKGWVETSGSDELPLEVVEEEPGAKLVLKIASSDLPFGGTWTYVLAPAGEGKTRLTITEDGYVDNALFRFMARFVFGYAKTLEGYLRDLGAKFGESVEVVSSPGVARAR